MSGQPNPRECVGIGLYTINDAAHLLKAPSQKVRRWMEGYGYTGKDGVHRSSDPLWRSDLPEIDEKVEISFRDLIELRLVRAFVEEGLGLKAIRFCLDYARECIGSDRPFSSGRFQTDGRRIFLETLSRADDPMLLDLQKKQYVFHSVVEQTFKDLDLEDDVVTRWRPYHGKETIVLDPKRAFGQPIAAEFGVPTIALAEAVEAEGSMDRAAALYEVDISVVRHAVAFEQELAAA